jgi:hypothetical protein
LRLFHQRPVWADDPKGRFLGQRLDRAGEWEIGVVNSTKGLSGRMNQRVVPLVKDWTGRRSGREEHTSVKNGLWAESCCHAPDDGQGRPKLLNCLPETSDQ